jgi:hypothetical protein
MIFSYIFMMFANSYVQYIYQTHMSTKAGPLSKRISTAARGNLSGMSGPTILKGPAHEAFIKGKPSPLQRHCHPPLSVATRPGTRGRAEVKENIFFPR